ncbi:T9SS sorting signal type C domain-containing protein [Flavobacterium sp. RSSB_23]|uniref:T9SS sorting signal type C domain-containing protein n=1 Tax=Flavobacterium sp. RSSB_23 TaxID=3447668 RepID=UPI003F2C306D
MKRILLFVVFLMVQFGFGQTSIWTNPITGTNPSTSNPYTTGQIVDSNIAVSGIGRGSGITAIATNDRYDATGWNTSNGIDLNDYFEFTLTPNAGYEIDLTSFVYTSTVSATNQPTRFAFRSSIDGFATNIVTPSATGTTINLSGAAYQNITSAITFRIYAYRSGSNAGTFGINDFTFNGTVSCNSNLSVTGTTICQGGSGSLNAGTTITTGATKTISGSWNTTINPTAVRPGGETSGPFDDTTTCLFIAGQVRSYVATSFQVTTTGNYSFVMTNNDNYDGMGYIYRGNFVPGNCSGGGTFIRGDDDTRVFGTVTTDEPSMFNVPLTAGVTYTLVTTTWSTTTNDSFIWTVTPPSGGNLVAPSWYTTATGGSAIGTGSPFNPVGVPGSGLSNTNTAGTTTFYAGFPSISGCRTAANFVINPSPQGSLTANGPFCVTGAGQLTWTATAGTGPYTVIYNDGVSNRTRNNVTSGTAFATFTTPVTANTTYTLVSVTGSNGCARTTGFTGASATITVNPTTVGGSVTGGTTICSGSTSGLLTLGGATGTVQRWESSVSPFTVWTTIANTNSTYTSGTLTQTTQFRAVVKSGACLEANSSSTTVTVSPNNTVGSPSSSPNLCIGTLMTSITHTTTGATGIGTALGLPAGVSASWASNTITISGAPTASGTFNYSIALDGGCGSVLNATGTITVNPLPSAPTIGPITHPTCTVATGSFQITAYDSARTYAFNPAILSISGTGLVTANPGDYSFTVDNATGCISLPTLVTIDPQKVKTWTGTTSTDWNTDSNWSPIGVPTVSDCVVIPDETNDPIVTTLSADANANTLQVDANASLTINSLRTLTVVDKITVAGSGTLIFNDKSSLVQTTNVTNTGAIEYRRISSPMKNFDYTYWSSPVWGDGVVVPKQTAKNLSPNTLSDKYFRFNGNVAVSDWVFDDGEMTPGVGFIIRVPKPGTTYPNGENWNTPTYSQPVAFKGTPNNGDYTFTAGVGEFNLIGNPYPSAIDADLFITNPNNAPMINGALYFWTHNTAITNNEYTADDYASYTLTGGTGTGVGVGNFVPEWVDANSNQIVDSGEFTDRNGNGFLDKLPEWVDANNNNVFESGEWNDVNNNNKLDLPTFEVTSNRPLGKIAAGQSFFVENSIAGGFQFTNAMRATGNNSQFFKQANTKKTATVEKNRVWLNLTNSKGAFKQLLVGYITGATNDWDNLYDGPTFDGQEFVDFYSVNQGKNLTIQGRALPFVDTDVVPLGYRSTIAGPFDISIDNRDGALAGQEIWLEDKKTNTLHELSKGKYMFTAINGVENDRFVLKYTNKTLGTDDNEVADKSLIVSVKNKKITLTSSAEAITQVQIFDLLGRKVYDKSKINAQEWSISNLSSSEQTLIVKTTLANGAISNNKIIY